MKAELKAKWVAALRSGDYRQVNGSLKEELEAGTGEFGYCCLGVLCELMEIPQATVSHEEEEGYRKEVIFNFRGLVDEEAKKNYQSTAFEAGGSFPFEAAEKVGLMALVPPKGVNFADSVVGKGDNFQSALIALNDQAAWGFESIATFIEEFMPEEEE